MAEIRPPFRLPNGKLLEPLDLGVVPRRQDSMDRGFVQLRRVVLTPGVGPEGWVDGRSVQPSLVIPAQAQHRYVWLDRLDREPLPQTPADTDHATFRAEFEREFPHLATGNFRLHEAGDADTSWQLAGMRAQKTKEREPRRREEVEHFLARTADYEPISPSFSVRGDEANIPLHGEVMKAVTLGEGITPREILTQTNRGTWMMVVDRTKNHPKARFPDPVILEVEKPGQVEGPLAGTGTQVYAAPRPAELPRMSGAVEELLANPGHVKNETVHWG